MGESNSKQRADVPFNRLPSLVREWDKNNQENIDKYHQTIMQGSVLNSQNNMNTMSLLNPNSSMMRSQLQMKQSGFKVTTEGNNMIKNYLSNIFDEDGDSKEEIRESQKERLLQGSVRQGEDEEYTINEDDEAGDQGAETMELNINTYQDGAEDLTSLRKKRKSGARTEYDVMSNQLSSPRQVNNLRRKNELLQYLKSSSIVEEETKEIDDRSKYKKIYSSDVNKITSFQVKDLDQQRTESFRDNLDASEFKKYLAEQKKNTKKVPITQRLMSRKEIFGSSKKRKNGRLTKRTENKLKQEDLNIRKYELQQKAKERKQKLDKDNFLKITREQMMTNVCQIIFKHIEAAQKFIENPTEAAMLFHENNFTRHEWIIQTTSGYSSTMPLFLYSLEEIEYIEKPAAEGDLILFMRKIFEKMQLASECIIISLIYLEKVMINGGIEIRYCNWKPLLFAAILISSKFWEDINFWNVDYVEAIGLYHLKSINRMESQFVSLCDYNLFVSAELYTQYYMAVREINNPIYSAVQSNNMPTKHFNRFKGSDVEQQPPTQQHRFKRIDSQYGDQLQGQDELFKSESRINSSQYQRQSSVNESKKNQLPVLVTQNLGGTKGPQYPSVKVNVNQFKEEAQEILEESIEEKRKESIKQSKRRPSGGRELIKKYSEMRRVSGYSGKDFDIIQEEDISETTPLNKHQIVSPLIQ
ncbi:cyclin-y-like protein [Stylonychia lemnae]|uniref:Cyclin-y-like protein n=1 Tax=Stylonychia lemnae TaxID=5949 RepID=A0A078AQ20_STYLE|nr:cyclin-y-like protein [Stylonychia lemnae]|eukprot:CDW84264.1 cyclin-y-like protein [Stylonychia lemnae]